MRSTFALVLLVPLLAACAGPEVAWLGRYSGTYQCDGSTRGTGEPYVEGPSAQTIRIEQDAGSGAVFVAGRCPIWLTVRSETYAEPYTDSCETVTPAGARVRLDVVGGAFALREPELAYEFGATITLPDDGVTVDANCTFEGVRID